MYTASVKMMNTGNSDNNQIKYLGESKDQDLNVQTANNTKDDAHPFYVGDQMMYVGYAEVNGTAYQSQLIQQQQFASEDFIFQFQVQGDIPSEFTCGISTISDHEGNVYNTVQIGTQCWTKENMRCTTSPSTGTTILENPAYSYSFSGKKAYYVDGNANNTLGYGLLYNWCAAVDTFNTQYGEISTNEDESSALYVVFSGNRRGICPQGWHVPNPSEWITLITYVRSQSDYICGDTTINIAKALASTAGWNSSTTTCAVGNTPSHNNATGFSAMPAGENHGSGYSTSFWTADMLENNTERVAYYRELYYDFAKVIGGVDLTSYAHSVRCIRD